MKNRQSFSLLTYFKKEKKLLILTAITGVIYNVGLTAGPLLEGQLAQYLYDILGGTRPARDILILSLIYVCVIAIVQAARALKRLYVRKFANNVSRSMKESIYHHLVHETYAQARKEDTGAVMTRAIADAEACAEGMRKFTTEVFDTGVVMVAYLATLFMLDWRLTFFVMLFPPAAYIVSAALKNKVSVTSSESKIAMSRLNDAALDLAGSALTYRIYGEDANRSAAYELVLDNYEKKNVAAGIWQNSPQPVYFVLSMIGVIPILYYGSRNVMGTGWTVWTIASFTAYLSCFTKLATKSSHAAKLFNAIQKARVSWDRIRDYLKPEEEEPASPEMRLENKSQVPQQQGRVHPAEKADSMAVSAGTALQAQDPGRAAQGRLQMKHVSFTWPGGAFSLHDLNFEALPGQIIGITGRVASGKSTFGKIFLREYPYEGRILYDGHDIAGSPLSENAAAAGTAPRSSPSSGSLSPHAMLFAYAGHDPELFTGSIRDNITFGDNNEERLKRILQEVQIDGEVNPSDRAGMEGSTLSGGQQARIALARALYSPAPVLILDDPFAAVDRATEKKIFQALRQCESRRIILIISHRMELFPRMDQILFLENGTMKSGTHEQMMQIREYAALYAMQSRSGDGRSEKETSERGSASHA